MPGPPHGMCVVVVEEEGLGRGKEREGERGLLLEFIKCKKRMVLEIKQTACTERSDTNSHIVVDVHAVESLHITASVRHVCSAP